ncbi:MAG: response regulator [Oscillospiraceae bacterium]|nr:response regulator [Oscillospiraceae bacterium]
MQKTDDDTRGFVKRVSGAKTGTAKARQLPGGEVTDLMKSPEPKNERKRGRNGFDWKKSLRFRLMGVLAIVPIILGIAVLIGVYYIYQNRILDEYKESAASAAKMIASRISGEELDRYAETLEEDEEYHRLLELMRLTVRGMGAEYIYISKYTEGGEIFLFDADENEEDKFALGEFEDWRGDHYDLEILARLLRGERVEPYTVRTRWGWLLTTHEPVFRADGSVAGYANVDLSMEVIMRERGVVFALVGLIVLIAFSVAVVFNLYVLQRYIISPIRRLVTGVSLYRPGEGAAMIARYSDERDDEIGELARQIIKMMGDIEHRDNLLQKRNAEWEAVMSNYKGAIWSVDEAGTITTFRGRYLEVIGVTPDFLEGKKLESARMKNRHEDIIESVEKTFREGPQDWIGGIGGKVFRSNTAPIFDDNGKVIGVVGSTDDISEMVELQKDLEVALTSAQAASRAKSDFLANMSHEIRTPMNAIIGMTNIAKTSQSSERKDYALGRIGEASTHLLGIINDILDMSKIEAGKLELHNEPFIFEDMLKSVINIINFRVVEKRQKLAVYIDDKIPRKLICDDQRLAQVITNLLSNAVKFTPENGTISLNAALFSDEDESCGIKFDVTDTGVGIDEEQQARLFNPFEQAESSTTRKYGGTGLGLTISKRIIELMDGGLTVSSALGEGSTFSFTVRCKKPDEDPLDIPVPPGNIRAEDIKVLIVDDDDDIREYFVDIAMRFSISCDTAAGGEEAMALIDGGKSYDICFVDWKMPGMNGIELSRRIKEKDEAEAVIMISSVEWNDIEAEAKDAGIDEFLPKPIFPSSFIECINRFLGVDLLAERQDEESQRTDRFWGYRVLLAEDVEINREIVTALLEPTLLETDCASDGAEAVRMFAEDPERYNIIFMDLQMPVMDGFEATRAIRAMDHERAKTIPVIAMTANVFKEDVENCLEAGMDDHIGKPLDFDAVLHILRRYLYRQKPSKERRKEERRKGNTDRRRAFDRRKSDRRKDEESDRRKDA